MTDFYVGRQANISEESVLLSWIKRNQVLHQICNNTSTQLNLTRIPLSQDDFKLIIEVLSRNRINTLTELDFRDCNLTFTKQMFDWLYTLAQANPSIFSVVLAGNDLSAISIEPILVLLTSRKYPVPIGCSTVPAPEVVTKYNYRSSADSNTMDFKQQVSARLVSWQYTGNHHFHLVLHSLRMVEKTGINLDNKDFSNLDFKSKAVRVEHSSGEGGSYTTTVYYYLEVLPYFSLKQTDFFKANISGSHFTSVTMEGSDLSHIIGEGVTWYQVDLTKASVAFANFRHARLRKCIFSRVYGMAADFYNVYANKSIFLRSDLRYASFAGAKLCKANFSYADLRWADFSNANVKGANFTNADLRFTTGLTEKMLSHCVIAGAKLPRHLKILGSIPPLPNEVDPKSPLFPILQTLAERQINLINSLSLSQLKTLYVEGKTNNATKPFVTHHEELIKERARKLVMQKHLVRIFGIYGLNDDTAGSILNQEDYYMPNKIFTKNMQGSLLAGLFSIRNKKTFYEKLSLIVIKPKGLLHLALIMNMLQRQDIQIVACQSKVLSQSEAKELYKNDSHKYFFTALIKYLSSGTSFQLAVLGNINELQKCKRDIRQAINSAMHEQAKNLYLAKWPKRATESDIELWGQEYIATFDVIHCSDEGQGKREVDIFFKKNQLELTPLSIENKTKIIRTLLQSPLKRDVTTLHISSATKAASAGSTPPLIISSSSGKAVKFLMIIKTEGNDHLPAILIHSTFGTQR